MALHTSFKKGTPVFYILKDGMRGEGKFKDKKNGYVILEEKKIPIKNIRAMTIRKLKDV